MATCFALVSLAMRAAVRVYFRRLRVRHAERFPAHGPVLLVANHPAMWTDVLVLDVALRRKLHFLAQGQLFRSPFRRWLLELHGALPLYAGGAAAQDRSLNEGTMARCRELFARGEVVALFPEGVSESERSVLPLKTGAARLALDAVDRVREAHAVPVVLAAGIHYADRTSYGSEVTVSLGDPLDLSTFRARVHEDGEHAVHTLTEVLHAALRSLILDLPEPELAAAVTELEPLAGLAHAKRAASLESAQHIAAVLDEIRTREPGDFAAIRRHARSYRRARRALRLSDRALHGDPASPAWRARTGLLALYCGLGALPALCGAVLHALPWAAGEWIAHSVRRDPTRFTFGRIASGLLFFPLTYAGLFAVLTQLPGVPPALAAGLLPLTFLLGIFTLHYAERARALADRMRLLCLSARRPRLVGRARREQLVLLQRLARASRTASGPDPDDGDAT
jgi:1-acyl-sn-glycerol-3-phosphate acyltransferase